MHDVLALQKMVFPPYGRGGRFSILLSQRVIVILYTFFLTFFHTYVASSTTVSLFLEAYNPKTVAVIMASVALLHIYGAIMMFFPYDILTKKIDAFIESRRQLSDKEQPSTQKRPTEILLQPVTKAVDIWDSYFSDNGVLGRRGRYFELRLLGREAIEIPCQTFQAVIMSQKIPNPLLIKLYVWVIIIDCILVPLLMGVKYVKSLSRRNLVVLLDSFVDLSLGVVIPASVCAMPLAQYFQNPIITTNRAFTGELISTTKFIVVTSFTDLVATVMPLIFMHFLITTAHENWTDIEANINVLKSTRGDTSDVAANSIVPLSAVPNPTTTKTSSKVSTQSWRQHWIAIKAAMGIASILWGFWLLLLLARQGEVGDRHCKKIPSCVTPLQPLISDENPDLPGPPTCACLVVDLHCDTLRLPLEKELMKLNPTYPLAMDLASCNNVTSLPEVLESFETLAFLELHDFHNINTLSFDFTTLSRLIFLRISHFSGLTQIPETLKNLPQALNTIWMNDMEQLKVIPTWVSSHWKQLTRLYLERMGIEGFPTPILDLEKLAIMSLNGNPNVFVIPPQVENFKVLEVLSLTNTNISSLPPAVWNLEKLRYVSVGHNNIATLEDLGGSDELLNRIQNWPSTFKDLIALTGNPICQTYKEELSAHPDACASECSPTCSSRLELDYKCDPECNTESCGFDRGFCKI